MTIKSFRGWILLPGILLAAGLAADSSHDSGGFLYSDYLRGGAESGVAGSFRVQTPRPVFGRGGAAAGVFSDSAARFSGISARDWALDYALTEADLGARLQARAVAEGWNVGRGLAGLAVSAAAEEWLNSGALRTVEFDLQSALGGRFGHAGLNVLGSLRDTADDAVAWQFRGYAGDESGGNAGLIYRREIKSKQQGFESFLAGGNLFLDYETRDSENFWRLSFGGEVRSPWVDGFVNYYGGMTDDVAAAGGGISYTASGYDLEVQVHSPRYSWLIGRAGYYLWRGEFGNEDEEGLRGGLRVLPLGTPLQFDIEYQSGEAGNKWGGRVLFEWELGKAPTSANRRGGAFNVRDWFYVPVEREYTQRIRTGANPPSGSPFSIGALRIASGGGVFVFGSTSTLTIVAEDAANPPLLPNEFPLRISTSGGAGMDLEFNGSGAVGTIVVESELILYEIKGAVAPMSLIQGRFTVDVDAGVVLASAGVGVVSVRAGGIAAVALTPEVLTVDIAGGNGAVEVGSGVGTVAVSGGGRASVVVRSNRLTANITGSRGVVGVATEVGTVAVSNGGQAAVVLNTNILMVDIAADSGGMVSAVVGTIAVVSDGRGAVSFNFSEGAGIEDFVYRGEGVRFITDVSDEELSCASPAEALPSGVVQDCPLMAGFSPASAVAVFGAANSGVLATIQGSGGGVASVGEYRYTLAGASAAGDIEVDNTSGEIRYTTPFTATANFAITVSVYGVNVSAIAATLTVRVISPPPLRLALPTLASAVIDSTADRVLLTAVASGGYGTYTYSLINAPDEIEIDSGNGVVNLTGIFAAPERDIQITVAVESAGVTEMTATMGEFLLRVVEPSPVVVDIAPSFVLATVGDSTRVVLARVNASGGLLDYTYGLAGAPVQVEINTDGEIELVSAFSFAEAGNTYTATVTAESRTSGSGVITISVVPEPIMVALSRTSVFAVSGESGRGAELSRATGAGGIGPYTFGLGAGAPGELAISTENGVGVVRIDAAFSAAQNYDFDVVITGSGGARATARLTLVIGDIDVVFTPNPAEVVYGAFQSGVLATVAVVGDDASAANHRYTLAGTPPNSIVLNAESGIITYGAAFLAADNDFILTVSVGGVTGGEILTGELQVNIVAPPELRLEIPAAAAVIGSDENIILATARAEGGYGGGGYLYSLADGAPEQLEIDENSGVLRVTGVFLDVGELRVTVSVRSISDISGAVITAAGSFALTLTPPQELRLDFSAPLAAVIGSDADIVLATARAEGGYPGRIYLYELAAGAPEEVEINRSSGAVRVTGVFGGSVRVARITVSVSSISGIPGAITITENSFAFNITTPPPVVVNLEQTFIGVTAFTRADIQAVATGGLGEGYTFSLTSHTFDAANNHDFFALTEDGNIIAGEARDEFVAGRLSFELNHLGNVYTLTVMAESGGITGEAALTVSVILQPKPLEVVYDETFFRILPGFASGARIIARLITVRGATGEVFRVAVRGNAPLDLRNEEVRTSSGNSYERGEFKVTVILADLIGTQGMAVLTIQVRDPDLIFEPGPAAVIGINNATATFATAVIFGDDPGRSNYRFTLLASPPSEISINTNSGEISYTSAFTAATSFMLTVRGGRNFANTVYLATATLAVNVLTPAALAAVLPSESVPVPIGVINTAVATITATGGFGEFSYLYSLTNAPAQLTINERNGVVSVIGGFLPPEREIVAGVQINSTGPTSSSTVTGTFTLTLNATPPVEVEVSPSIISVVVGSDLGRTLAVVSAASGGLSGGAALSDYEISLAPGAAEQLSLTAEGEIILAEVFNQTAAGRTHVVKVLAARGVVGTALLTIVIEGVLLPLAVEVDDSSAVVIANAPGREVAQARGINGIPPYSYEINGAPSGVVINATSGVLSIPSMSAGEHGFNIVAVDSANTRAETRMSLQVQAEGVDIRLEDSPVRLFSAPAVLGRALAGVSGESGIAYQYGLSLASMGGAVAESGSFQANRHRNLSPDANEDSRSSAAGGLVIPDDFGTPGGYIIPADFAPPGLVINVSTGVIFRGTFIQPGNIRADVIAVGSDSNGAAVSTLSAPFEFAVIPESSIMPQAITVIAGEFSAAAAAAALSVVFDDLPGREYTWTATDAFSYSGFGNLRVESNGEVFVDAGLEAGLGWILVRAEAAGGIVREGALAVEVRESAEVSLIVYPEEVVLQAAEYNGGKLLMQAAASGGDGNYSYTLEGAPAGVEIDGLGEIRQVQHSGQITERVRFRVIAVDSAGMRATATVFYTVEAGGTWRVNSGAVVFVAGEPHVSLQAADEFTRSRDDIYGIGVIDQIGGGNYEQRIDRRNVVYGTVNAGGYLPDIYPLRVYPETDGDYSISAQNGDSSAAISATGSREAGIIIPARIVSVRMTVIEEVDYRFTIRATIRAAAFGEALSGGANATIRLVGVEGDTFTASGENVNFGVERGLAPRFRGRTPILLIEDLVAITTFTAFRVERGRANIDRNVFPNLYTALRTDDRARVFATDRELERIKRGHVSTPAIMQCGADDINPEGRALNQGGEANSPVLSIRQKDTCVGTDANDFAAMILSTPPPAVLDIEISNNPLLVPSFRITTQTLNGQGDTVFNSTALIATEIEVANVDNKFRAFPINGSGALLQTLAGLTENDVIGSDLGRGSDTEGRAIFCNACVFNTAAFTVGVVRRSGDGRLITERAEHVIAYDGAGPFAFDKIIFAMDSGPFPAGVPNKFVVSLLLVSEESAASIAAGIPGITATALITVQQRPQLVILPSSRTVAEGARGLLATVYRPGYTGDGVVDLTGNGLQITGTVGIGEEIVLTRRPVASDIDNNGGVTFLSMDDDGENSLAAGVYVLTIRAAAAAEDAEIFSGGEATFTLTIVAAEHNLRLSRTAARLDTVPGITRVGSDPMTKLYPTFSDASVYIAEDSVLATAALAVDGGEVFYGLVSASPVVSGNPVTVNRSGYTVIEYDNVIPVNPLLAAIRIGAESGVISFVGGAVQPQILIFTVGAFWAENIYHNTDNRRTQDSQLDVERGGTLITTALLTLIIREPETTPLEVSALPRYAEVQTGADTGLVARLQASGGIAGLPYHYAFPDTKNGGRTGYIPPEERNDYAPHLQLGYFSGIMQLGQAFLEEQKMNITVLVAQQIGASLPNPTITLQGGRTAVVSYHTNSATVVIPLNVRHGGASVSGVRLAGAREFVITAGTIPPAPGLRVGQVYAFGGDDGRYIYSLQNAPEGVSIRQYSGEVVITSVFTAPEELALTVAALYRKEGIRARTSGVYKLRVIRKDAFVLSISPTRFEMMNGIFPAHARVVNTYSVYVEEDVLSATSITTGILATAEVSGIYGAGSDNIAFSLEGAPEGVYIDGGGEIRKSQNAVFLETGESVLTVVAESGGITLSQLFTLNIIEATELAARVLPFNYIPVQLYASNPAGHVQAVATITASGCGGGGCTYTMESPENVGYSIDSASGVVSLTASGRSPGSYLDDTRSSTRKDNVIAVRDTLTLIATRSGDNETISAVINVVVYQNPPLQAALIEVMAETTVTVTVANSGESVALPITIRVMPDDADEGEVFITVRIVQGSGRGYSYEIPEGFGYTGGAGDTPEIEIRKTGLVSGSVGTIIITDEGDDTRATMTFMIAGQCPLVYTDAPTTYVYSNVVGGGGATPFERTAASNHYCDFLANMGDRRNFNLYIPNTEPAEFRGSSTFIRKPASTVCADHSSDAGSNHAGFADGEPDYGDIIALFPNTDSTTDMRYVRGDRNGHGSDGFSTHAEFDHVFRIYRGASDGYLLAGERSIGRAISPTEQNAEVRSCTLGADEFWLDRTDYTKITDESDISDAITERDQ